MRKFSIDLSSLNHITIIFHSFHTIKKKTRLVYLHGRSFGAKILVSRRIDLK